MNGITSGNSQAGGAARTPVTPYTPSETADLKATGFGFSEKGGVDWDTWINTARTSKDPVLQAQYRELVDLAGGRKDNASLKAVMERVQQLQFAASPNASAADQVAAMRGMENQLTTALSRSGMIEKFTGSMQDVTQYLRADPLLGNSDWGKALSTVLATQKQSAAFQLGLVEGVWEGGKSMVMGVVSLAGKTLQYGADTSQLGWAGDRLRGITGKMPGWIDAVIPSAERGASSTAALKAMGSGISNYLSTKSVAEIAGDIKGAIGNAWDGLKADHAKAAAQGPEAEARWWGQTLGRVGFEVGATFIPVAGQAGKVSAGARMVDAAADGARVLDKVADGARVVDKAADGVRAGEKVADDIPLGAKAPEPQRFPDPEPPRQRIVMDAGKKGDWPKELNARNLEPNADYVINGYKFATDVQGRVVSVEGKLDLKVAERNGYQQKISGRDDRLPDDQGGHLIASIFNGPGDRLNLVPMNGNFNMGAWRNLEDKLAAALKDGRKVEVKIDVVYPDSSGRPSQFVVTSQIDGIQSRQIFSNIAGG